MARNAIAPVVMPSTRARFPRTPGPANPAVLRPGAGMPAVAAFDPPAPSAAAQAPERAAQAVDRILDQETYAKTLAVDSRGTGKPGTPPEVLIYQTISPWRALDVYLAPIPPSAGFSSNCIFHVFIYAITAGTRALVASGRYAVIGAGVNHPPSKRIASIRSVAQKFEVTLLVTQASGAPFVTGQYTIACVASNEAVDAPDDVGAELASACYLSVLDTGLRSVGVGVAGVQLPPRLELISMRAVNGSAAARFLQLHDTTLNVITPGAVPLMVWPLGNAAGQGLGEMFVGYRATNRLQLVVSSTMNTLTVETDCSVSALVR